MLCERGNRYHHQSQIYYFSQEEIDNCKSKHDKSLLVKHQKSLPIQSGMCLEAHSGGLIEVPGDKKKISVGIVCPLCNDNTVCFFFWCTLISTDTTGMADGDQWMLHCHCDCHY